MTSPRHKAVEPARRPRPARPRLLRLALPATAATLVTASVVGVAVSRGHHQPVRSGDVAAKPMEQTVPVSGGDHSVYRSERIKTFSRSTDRVTLRKKPKVVDHEYRTAALNLWPAPREKGKPLAVLKSGGTVAVTGARKSGFAQILRDGQVRWVNQHYLSEKKPVAAKSSASGGSAAAASSGVSSAPCPDGSGTESGLTPSAVTLFRAVCNAFPALTTYGGYAPRGEHASGKAIDFMINGDSSLGQAIADWARAHAAQLNLYDVIWQQHIWTPERSSEGWRAMPDRGSPTANHFDHVHISVN